MRTMYSWPAVTGAILCLPLMPVRAQADSHNITYVARVDGVAPDSVATFITAEKQTNMSQLSALPGTTFQASAVLADPHQAGMQVMIRWPYSANAHCEIDVDDKVFVEVDQVLHPAPGSTDPMNGVLPCGAPLPTP